MKKRGRLFYVMVSVLLCAIAMSLVDAVLQPGYAVKSCIKAGLFLLVPMGYFLLWGGWAQMKNLFMPKKKEFAIAPGLGIAVYGIILGGYFLIGPLLDIDAIAMQLTEDGGVRADNFLWISLYISLVNSLLEEFLFRGFAFLTLKKLSNGFFAYVFSALVFAAYHFGMFAGSYEPLIWVLAMTALFIAGCALNFLNEKSGTIYPSWLVHMFANFGINTVGFIVFGII